MYNNTQEFLKKLRFECLENVNVDRISELPDPILVEILSLLPFAAAVATGVLSRRWLRLWTQLSSLRINSETAPLGCYWKFFTAIDQFLQQLSSPEIRTFEFRSPIPPPFNGGNELFKVFIRQIIDRHVRMIKVNFTDYEYILLPAFVLESRSLEVLVLCFGFDYELPHNGVNLPNLRKLDICIEDAQLDFVSKFVKSCPVLEDLRIEGDLSGYDHVIDIFAPNLKSLSIEMTQQLALTKVLINAPKLENFHVSGPNLLKYCFAKVPSSLCNVQVCTTFDCGVSPKGGLEWELVRSIANVKSFSIQGDMSAAFYYMNDYTLPVFKGLVSLEMGLHFPTFWKGLMRFLEFCPNLQIIRLHRKEYMWHGTGWIQLDCVPDCLSTRVRRVVFRDFVGVKQELELLSYVLMVAKVLETLQISIAAPISKEKNSLLLRKELEFCQELYKFPKGSKSCQIKVVNQYLHQ